MRILALQTADGQEYVVGDKNKIKSIELSNANDATNGHFIVRYEDSKLYNVINARYVVNFAGEDLAPSLEESENSK